MTFLIDMDSIQKECKEFQLTKMELCRVKSHIYFLKKCKRLNILPSFTSIKSNTKTRSGKMAVQKARHYWLVSELQQCYARIAKIDEKSYYLFQKISNKISSWDITRFMDMVMNKCRKCVRNECFKKRAKIRNLKIKQNYVVKTPLKSEFIPDFIVNKSSIELDQNEINLLNKGLNFALPCKIPPNKRNHCGYGISVKLHEERYSR